MPPSVLGSDVAADRALAPTPETPLIIGGVEGLNGGTVVSPNATADLKNPFVSYVPDRHKRPRDAVINGSISPLPSWPELSSERFDSLMLQPIPDETPEAYNARLPKRFLRFRRFVLRSALDAQEKAVPELEKSAARMWHGADTTVRQQSSSAKGTDSAVTRSAWYANNTSPETPGTRVHRLAAKTSSEQRRINRIGRIHRSWRKHRNSGINANKSYRNTDPDTLHPKAAREVRKTNKYGRRETDTANKKLEKIVEIATAPARELVQTRKLVTENRAKLAAMNQAIEARQEAKDVRKIVREAKKAAKQDDKELRKIVREAKKEEKLDRKKSKLEARQQKSTEHRAALQEAYDTTPQRYHEVIRPTVTLGKLAARKVSSNLRQRRVDKLSRKIDNRSQSAESHDD